MKCVQDLDDRLCALDYLCAQGEVPIRKALRAAFYSNIPKQPAYSAANRARRKVGPKRRENEVSIKTGTISLHITVESRGIAPLTGLNSCHRAEEAADDAGDAGDAGGEESHDDVGLGDVGADGLVGEDAGAVDVHLVLHHHVLPQHAHALHTRLADRQSYIGFKAMRQKPHTPHCVHRSNSVTVCLCQTHTCPVRKVRLSGGYFD